MSDSSFEVSVVYALTASHLTLKYLRVFVWLPTGYRKSLFYSTYQVLPCLLSSTISLGPDLIGSVCGRNQYYIIACAMQHCSCGYARLHHAIWLHTRFAWACVCNLYQALCFSTALWKKSGLGTGLVHTHTICMHVHDFFSISLRTKINTLYIFTPTDYNWAR